MPILDTGTPARHTAFMATIILERFLRLARYNRRANREICEAAAGLTDRALRRDVGSWFGSIYGILNHVLVCDIHWMRRFRALDAGSAALNDPCLDPPNLSWEHALHEELCAFREHRDAVDGRIEAWFAQFPQSRYGEPFEYRDSRGSPQRVAAAADAFDFLFVHQTHHRGQLSQILDVLGVPNNPADNLRFLAGGGD